MSSAIGLEYLVGLTGVVAFGAIVPVVPTGAAVSVAAALGDRNPFVFLLVVAFGAAGAYVGDISTYAILRLAGQPLAQRVGWLHEGHTADTLVTLRKRVEEHELPVLLTSRLIPGGRVPVLLAAALGGYSWRRFATADIAAAALWSAFYAGIGVAGRAVFPEPWEAAVFAIALVLVVTGISAWWSGRRKRRSPPVAAAAPDVVEDEPTTGR
jgi:membrane protein DedA with SNARE-associated domain